MYIDAVVRPLSQSCAIEGRRTIGWGGRRVVALSRGNAIYLTKFRVDSADESVTGRWGWGYKILSRVVSSMKLNLFGRDVTTRWVLNDRLAKENHLYMVKYVNRIDKSFIELEVLLKLLRTGCSVKCGHICAGDYEDGPSCVFYVSLNRCRVK